MFKLISFFFIVLSFIEINSESIHTSLKNKEDIERFIKITSEIRCICIPSIPIKDCSYNNCPVSAELKKFIENRILEGDEPEQIIKNLSKGFGKDIINDRLVKEFMEQNKSQLVEGIVFGFGKDILINPSSFWINMSLLLIVVIGLIFVLINLKFKKNKVNQLKLELASNVSKYLAILKNRKK